MEIPKLLKITILVTALFGYTLVFAQTASDTAIQNANTAASDANIAKSNAATASQNASNAAADANTASQNADVAANNANIAAKMITPVPAPKEVTIVPAGFTNCFVVQDGWFGGIWVPQHRVCQYNPNKEGVAWIEGYWACTQYKTIENSNGECTNWDWKPGRWVRTFSVY